ncbi:TerC Membrane protein TerC, possibly involved in tellurium resistance [Burkholderiales bacterium]
MEGAAIEFGTAAFFVALLQIVWIDLLLSGDNSIVIALACRNLPPNQRRLGIFWGVSAAIALRVILTAFAVTLLTIPMLKLVGGLLLLYIGVKLVLPQHDEDEHEIDGKDRLFDAIKTIVIADFAMSLDNVIGVAGAAKGNFFLLIFGLALSIPLVVWGSKIVLMIISRFPVVIMAGGALLGYLAGEMIQTDPWLKDFWSDTVGLGGHELAWVGLALVLILGKLLARRAPPPPPAEVH